MEEDGVGSQGTQQTVVLEKKKKKEVHNYITLSLSKSKNKNIQVQRFTLRMSQKASVQRFCIT
jgi:hypothetical protein